MESAADQFGDEMTSHSLWLEDPTIGIQTVRPNWDSAPVIGQFGPTTPAPLLGDDNRTGLCNSTDYDTFIEDTRAYGYEAQHTAFPWAQNSNGFQDATAFPNASMGCVGGDAGPACSNTWTAYTTGFFDALNLQAPLPEVVPAAAGPATNTIRPTAAPMQQMQLEYIGTQQRQTPKPFQCNHPRCNSKSFKRKYELQRHAKKHSRSQRIFLCPVAGCRFQQSADAFYRHDKLACHMKSCHPDVQVPAANASVAPTQAGTHNIPTHNTFQG